MESSDGIVNKATYNLEAEQSILGAVLIDSSCFSRVVEIVPYSDYFYSHNHKIIYSAMIDMFTSGEAMDYVTILNKLKANASQELEHKELKTYLLELAQVVPSVSNVEYYANIVKDKYNTRVLETVAKEIIESIKNEEMESSDILNMAEQKIFDIRKEKETKGLQKINKIVLQSFDRLDKLNSENAAEYLGIPTGISKLDNVISGLNKTDLILVAARPGMGKTSFALNIAEHVSINEGKNVAFFSLEMSKEQLALRMLSTIGEIPGNHLRNGKLNEKEWGKLIEAGSVVSKANLYVDDTPAITIPEMKAKIRRFGHFDLVIIDYLQLMSSAKKIQSRVQEISELTRSLKIMAKELNVPVITLSQLSRASEQRSSHKPVLSDLRDSGSIEQDADIVMFLYRDGYYNDEVSNNSVSKNIGECIVAKNRHGETRTVPLYWQGEYMKFGSVENNY